MRKTVIFTIFMTLTCGVFAMEFVPALDINGGLTYPTIVTGESSELDRKIGWDAGLAGSFLVNTDILPQLWFIPTLTANYSSTAQTLNVDDQRFLFSQWLDLYFSAGFNYQFDDSWEVRLRGLVRGDFAQQTADETLGNGLYDYIDRGFYAENSMTFGSDVKSELTAGFKYVDKRFPNYQTLSSQINPDDIGGTLNALAKNEKNNLTYSVYTSLDIQLGDSGWYPSLSFYYDYTTYLEQKIINLDGTLSGARRIDRLADIGIVFPYYANEVSGVNMGYTLAIKTTSQNYYDSLETPDPSDDVYTVDFYNYFEHTLNFVFTYELDDPFINAYKPSLSLGLNIDIIAYTERYAKNELGAYTNKKQSDFNYKIFLDIKHKITDFWNYYFDVTFTRFNSNMKWEVYGTFNYSLVTITLGTGLSF